jgi:hypothetical protein
MNPELLVIFNEEVRPPSFAMNTKSDPHQNPLTCQYLRVPVCGQTAEQRAYV